MQVGAALLDLARATGAPSLFFVGTGKNVGKTVALRAVYHAAVERGLRVGVSSVGRDGEAIDIGDGAPKPRLYLRAGTIVATACDVLPRSPASEILELSEIVSAAGRIAFVRVRKNAFYELVGAPTAAGVRSIVSRLLNYSEYAIVDGAVDRIAALAGGDDAVVVACGAADAPTLEAAVDAVRALVGRLQVRRFDADAEHVMIEGALTAARAAELIAAHERRQIVVRDPTRIALSGRAALHALEHLELRCERTLRVVATTVASIGRERTFEPREFARAVAQATGLPAFDVYAGSVASRGAAA